MKVTALLSNSYTIHLPYIYIYPYYKKKIRFDWTLIIVIAKTRQNV